MKRLLGAALTAGLVAAVSACSQSSTMPPPLPGNDNSTHPPGTGGPGTPDGGTSSDAPTMTSCTGFANSGPMVIEVYVGDQLPQPIGGTVAPGTYLLSNANLYTGAGTGNAGPTGTVYQETMTLDVATFTDVTAAGDADGGLGTPNYSSGMFTTVGPNFTRLASCPISATNAFTYTAVGTQLRLYQGQTEFIFAGQ